MGMLGVHTVVLKKIVFVQSVDGFLKWSESGLCDMASYFTRLGCQYTQMLFHSGHMSLIMHIMFHCGGLTC
jgi:hypothetical protein